MEAADPHRMSPTMISSPPPKRAVRHSKATLSARRIRIPNTRWPGCPGSLPVSADGIATTSRPVQRPCEPAGPNSPTGPKAIVLQWLCKMCESRSLVGEGGSNERSEFETGEGSVSADRDPSSGADYVRATLLPQGEKERRPRSWGTLDAASSHSPPCNPPPDAVLLWP